jgi:hypothetical protein
MAMSGSGIPGVLPLTHEATFDASRSPPTPDQTAKPASSSRSRSGAISSSTPACAGVGTRVTGEH